MVIRFFESIAISNAPALQAPPLLQEGEFKMQSIGAIDGKLMVSLEYE